MSDEERATDEELVERAQGARTGDWRAAEQLIRRHEGKIIANCRYLTRSPGDAEDLAQEVFAKAFFALDRFEGRSLFRTWLQRIKINHCLNFIKKRAARHFVDIEEPGLEGDPALQVEPSAETEIRSARQREAISETLDSLNDTLRVPLLLRDLDGLSYQEIAESLGVSLSAVKMRIKRGREEFRRLLAAREESP